MFGLELIYLGRKNLHKVRRLRSNLFRDCLFVFLSNISMSNTDKSRTGRFYSKIYTYMRRIRKSLSTTEIYQYKSDPISTSNNI